jgi:phenylpropionate dioxygenase-like ring-hydroxylating dioxygenase large terminal subunit
MYSLFQLAVASYCCLLSLFPFVESLQLTPRPGATAGASSISTASQSRLFRTAHAKPFLARKVASSRTTQNNIGLSAASTSLIEQADSSTSLSDGGAQLGAWIPIGSAAALASLSPTSVKVMNMDLAVWYSEETKQWSVLSDACPHRLAPLSQGRINPATGCIECPYHGWQFDTSGQVQDIPQWSGTKEELQNVAVEPNSKYNAQQFPIHVSGDMIFAFIPSAIHGESFPRSLMPEDMYPGLVEQKSKVYYVRDLPYSFDFLVENFMDPAHIPFAHHGLQGVRQDGSDIPMKMLVNNFTMVEVAYTDIVRNKTRE